MKNKLELIIAILLIGIVTSLAGIGTIAIGTTETEVLPASQYRKWVLLQNNSAGDIYVKVDSSTNTLTTTNGIKIPSQGGALILTSPSSPVGNVIKAISGSGTNTLTFQYGNE